MSESQVRKFESPLLQVVTPSVSLHARPSYITFLKLIGVQRATAAAQHATRRGWKQAGAMFAGRSVVKEQRSCGH